jgi:16S rRNA (adenine1518-N6/adenine1519-N6)-dimethyltransferase
LPPKLGQHFLNNGHILERIAAAVCPVREDLVVEIGPGKGALTEKLLKCAGRVVAIEVDHELVDHLRRRFAGQRRVEIVHADVLQTGLTQWGRAPVAGNLPYSIASPIIGRTVRLDVPRAVFLIQKEVAQRLVARPGERAYGYLTVQTALFANVRLLFDVKPGSFAPPPKVDSAVVLLEPRRRELGGEIGVDRGLHLGLDLGPSSPEDFLRFVGHCFRQKRKTLRNNLAPIYGHPLIDTWPEAMLRAEKLSLEDFAAMYRRLPV